MRIDSILLAALGAAAISLAPTALADPTDPVNPPGPDPAPVTDTVPLTNPAATPQPHLSSLDHLPPGTSAEPVVPEGRGLSYLRDLWHAVQTQEVSGADALLLLTQRPMSADTAPPGVPISPQPPPVDPQPAPAPPAAD